MEKKIVSTDVAIIGGGTIGLFIYTQLKKKFKEIKVLERGNTNPSINLYPDVGLTGLFKLFLDALPKTLTKVFSVGQLPSDGE